MEVSLKVSGKYLAITAAALGTVIGVGLGYRSYESSSMQTFAGAADAGADAAATAAASTDAAAAVEAAMR